MATKYVTCTRISYLKCGSIFWNKINILVWGTHYIISLCNLNFIVLKNFDTIQVSILNFNK